MVAVVFFLFNALNYCKIFKIWGTRVSYYHYHYHYYYVLLTINKLRLLYGSVSQGLGTTEFTNLIG